MIDKSIVVSLTTFVIQKRSSYTSNDALSKPVSFTRTFELSQM